MRVSTVLAAKGATVATVDPSATIAEVVDAFRLRGVGALVVTRDGCTVTGLVGERDVVRHLAEHGERVLRLTVVEVMSTDVPTCAPSDAVHEVMAVMTDRRVRHLPVVTDGVLSGIISIGDVVKARLGELEAEAHHLSTYVSTGR